MEWFYTRRRGPEWKQGWTGQTLGSISTPPLHLLTIFGIVFVLLWFSHYTGYQTQLRTTAMNFQLFLFLLPILLVLLMASNSSGWRFNFPLSRSDHGSSPLGIASLVVLLLVLLSYQSSFQSKWFGPLWRSG